MKCPDCKSKISTKHYDAAYGWYECPKCEGCFTPDEIEESNNGTSPQKRAKEAIKSALQAKGKEKIKEREKEAAAIEEFEKNSVTPIKSSTSGVVRYHNEVSTGEILNIIADEIEAIAEESGMRINRLNAREFYAMNIWRTLKLKHNVSAREKSFKLAQCKKHDE